MTAPLTGKYLRCDPPTAISARAWFRGGGSSLRTWDTTSPIDVMNTNSRMLAAAIKHAVPKMNNVLARPSIHCSRNKSPPTKMKAVIDTRRPRRRDP
jgi:hypothetical protein